MWTTSKLDIHIYLWLKRCLWPVKESDSRPFSLFHWQNSGPKCAKWMKMNEWNMHCLWRFLSPGCASAFLHLYVYLNVFKRPTIWGAYHCRALSVAAGSSMHIYCLSCNGATTLLPHVHAAAPFPPSPSPHPLDKDRPTNPFVCACLALAACVGFGSSFG